MTLVDMEGLVLAGVTLRGAFSDLQQLAPQAWSQMVAAAPSLTARVDRFYGVVQAHQAPYAYMIAVATDRPPPPGFDVLTLAPARYAARVCQGPRDQNLVSDAYVDLWADIEAAGLRRRSGAPGLEIYEQALQDAPGCGVSRFHFTILEPVET